jgi:hypothetical protein
LLGIYTIFFTNIHLVILPINLDPSFFASMENDAADVLILIPLVVPVLIVEAYKKGLGQVSLLKE